MEKPSEAVIETVAPAHDIGGLTIRDPGIRNVVGAELKNSLRLPRGGPHDATLVAVQKHYDGLSGGEAGTYLLFYVEFRTTSRWRTSGTKIRSAEASRVARDLLRGKASKPGKGEAPRIGGHEIARDDSMLCGAPIAGGNYVLYVKSKNKADQWVRARGVELLPIEIPFVVKELRALAQV